MVKNTERILRIRTNKRGWIRILESTIAVLLIATTLVIVFTGQPDRGLDAGEYVYLLQQELLNDLSLNQTLRNAIISMTDETVPEIITNHIDSKVPNSFTAKIRICDLEEPPKPCKLQGQDAIASLEKDVFVEDTIISSNITSYNPKKIRLFIWEN